MPRFQNKNVKDIKKKLNEDFANIWDWFVDSKLIVHFDKEKTMSIFFTSKRKIKKLQKLDIIYNNIRIKQYSWLLVVIMSRTRLRVNLHSMVAWMSRNSLLEKGTISEV